MQRVIILKYLEVSAKTGDNIELVFDKLAYDCVENSIRGNSQNEVLEVKSRTQNKGMINNLANNNAQPKIKIEKAKEKDEVCC